MSSWDDLPHGFEIRPVGVWPGTPTAHRERSPFRAGLTQTLRALSRELGMLRARETILRIDIRERDLRVDGRPRADARALSPGIVLNFKARPPGTREWLPLQYACDAFNDWRDNLRAIALSLEALRMVDRYGVSKAGEQYRGYQALPPGGTTLNGAGEMTPDEALTFLAEHGGGSYPVLRDDPGLRVIAYRAAARRLHPDTGGDLHLFKRLQAAKTALGL